MFTPEEILAVVLREMVAVGTGWRMDWSDFDGRTLRDQLDMIAEWAEKARKGQVREEHTEESEWCKEVAERAD